MHTLNMIYIILHAQDSVSTFIPCTLNYTVVVFVFRQVWLIQISNCLSGLLPLLSIFRWDLTHWRMPLISFGAQGQVGSDHRHPQRVVPSHSLPSVLRYAIFSGKPTTTNKTSLNKAVPLKNLKYAGSRWGTSFSAEVNAAEFFLFLFFQMSRLPPTQSGRLTP